MMRKHHAHAWQMCDIARVSVLMCIPLTQVVEEKYLDKYNVPSLMAVGLEGVFGSVIMFIFMVSRRVCVCVCVCVLVCVVCA